MSRMKKGFWILAGSLLLALPGAVDQAYAIKAGRLIDGQNAGAKTNVVIIVQGNKITEIGEKAAVPKGAVPIDLGDKTVLPGFINAHTHIMIDGGTDYGANLYKKSMPYRALEAASNCRQATLNEAAKTGNIRPKETNFDGSQNIF